MITETKLLRLTCDRCGEVRSFPSIDSLLVIFGCGWETDINVPIDEPVRHYCRVCAKAIREAKSRLEKVYQ
jgi:hypothetical protein